MKSQVYNYFVYFLVVVALHLVRHFLVLVFCYLIFSLTDKLVSRFLTIVSKNYPVVPVGLTKRYSM